MVAASHCALAVAPLAYASCARKRCYVEMWVLVGIVLMIPLVELCNHCLFLLKAFVNIRANVIGWKEVLGLSNLCLRNDLKLMGSQVVLMEFCMCINYAPALAAATVGIVLAQRATATAIAVACVLTAKGCHTWCSVFYQVSPKNFPVRAKCSPRINLYISSLPSIHFEFPSTLVNGKYGVNHLTMQLKLSPLVAQVSVHFCSSEIASLSSS
ncbi:hypothetical protein POTOM_019396 [Populus tomentosa]|uniref:Uncharacterized protein n=1 Tax=Populus tomentosa TaxID=118781 RepID=A0A8X8D339_POPTO|nr:hypothetical protein POTOM_019396 [Populus tomentosa]